MNLSKLFDMQRALDEKIIREKGLEGKDLLPMKILALQVELGECANEWRGFKFWSERQRSKYGEAAEIECPYCSGKGFFFRGERILCNHCHQTGKITSPLLEEFVDCLHFILSIGLELGLTESQQQQLQKLVNSNQIKPMNIVLLFSSLLRNNWDDVHEYGYGMRGFIVLGEKLGFTWEQIEQAYISKNEVNHNRQANGY